MAMTIRKQGVRDFMETKDRILAAAIELFGKYGLAGASVRDICSMAEANIAAINYYFGSKESLYGEVVKHVYDDVQGVESMPTLAEAPDDPEGQLAKWIDWYIRRQLDPRTEGLVRFIRREIADPTPMLQEIVDHSVTPLYMEMFTLVGAVLPEGASHEVIGLHCGQVNGPTIVRMLCRPITERMPEPGVTEIDVAAIVSHTQRCVMAGLKSSGAAVSERWLPTI